MGRCAGGCIGIWCVINHETDEKLGSALLLLMPIDEDDTNWDLVVGDALPDCEFEIGYILKKSAWGKGYATEACARLMRFAFEETPLQELVAVTDSENISSQSVLKKNGFASEGLRRAYAENIPGFRITRKHWLKNNPDTA
jgi:ribosomal-protein-alanine N-acetyltransferase